MRSPSSVPRGRIKRGVARPERRGGNVFFQVASKIRDRSRGAAS